jgi:putative membrane protein
MMGWYQDGMGWGGWILMTVAVVAFWALVFFAVVAILRDTQRSTESAPGHGDPLQILDERFARGEIDGEEYRTRSDVLRASVH